MTRLNGLRQHVFRSVFNLIATLLSASVLSAVGVFAAPQPLLIPQPREVSAAAAPFRIQPNTEIAVISSGSQEDVVAAQSIEKELEEITGHEVPIASTPKPPSNIPAIVLGQYDQPEMRALLESEHLDMAGIGAQGYVLNVERNRVTVAGKDAAGLFYGVQTLRQLAVRTEDGEAEILGVRVRDWPALKFRGTQVDLSRGPVPKLSYLKQIIQTISEFKMNQLYLYIEDSFRIKGQPLVGILSDTLSQSDWKDLVSYAAKYHVELVPATEACGHLHKILRFEQYSGLGELPHGQVLAAKNPPALNFLNSMYQQMLPIFPSPIYHIGCDETFELGQGRSKSLVQQEGYGKVYVDELKRVASLVESYNKQVMFWGDIAVEHPEMIPSLPKNLIVASWEYSAHPSYQRWLKPFMGTGMKIFVCPWTAGTNLIVPDYEEGAYNIEGFLTDGKADGAIGTDITVWNDDGETLYGPNWWPIIYGAACAWEPGKTDVQEFNRKYDWAFYRSRDPRIVNAIMDLSHLNEVIRAGGPVKTYDSHYGGAGDDLFWRDPFSKLGQQDVKKYLPIANLIRQTAERDYTTLVDAGSGIKRHRDTIADFKFAALRMDALGMRYQYAQEMSGSYASAYTEFQANHRGTASRDLSDITATNGRLQDLRDYTTRLTELYRERWLSENLPNWLPNMLQLYKRNSDLWQELIAKYSNLKTLEQQGQPLPSPQSLGLLTSEQASGK